MTRIPYASGSVSTGGSVPTDTGAYSPRDWGCSGHILLSFGSRPHRPCEGGSPLESTKAHTQPPDGGGPGAGRARCCPPALLDKARRDLLPPPISRPDLCPQAETRVGTRETRVGAREPRVGTREPRVGTREPRVGGRETRVGSRGSARRGERNPRRGKGSARSGDGRACRNEGNARRDEGTARRDGWPSETLHAR